DQRLHGLIVGGPKLAPGLERVAGDVAGGGGQTVAVLEQLAELGRGRKCAEELELRQRRRVRELEQPLQVLSWQAGARADQVFHPYLPGGLCAAQLERRVDARDGRVPAELLRVDQLGQEERRQGLAVGSDEEQRIGVDARGLAQLAHAESAFEG